MTYGEASSGMTVLETDRLVLRRWALSDAAVQRALWAERDPRVPPRRQISLDGHPTIADLEEWIRQDDPSAPLGLLVAVRKDGGAVVGYCGLIANSHGQDGEPELAYEFLREQWGQGLASEAAHAVVGWAASLGYTRLWATIRDWNVASQRVAINVGFARTTRVERDAQHGDSWFWVRDVQPERSSAACATAAGRRAARTSNVTG